MSSCKKTTPGGKCTGKYICEYEDDAPVFVCEKCGDKELSWKKFYTEYLDLFRVKDNWDVDKHKVTCVIGFFCHMYREFYKTSYIFVPQNPSPYSSKECRDAHKLLAAFGGNAHQTRKYIYWVFTKLIRRNTDITAFGYINTAGIIRKYKLQEQKKHILTRASNLPSAFIEWCKEYAVQIFDNYELSTMNDLGALLQYYDAHIKNPDSIEAMVINEARERKLVLENKLNIGG